MEIMNKKEFYKWFHDDGGSENWIEEEWKEFSVSEQKFYEDMKDSSSVKSYFRHRRGIRRGLFYEDMKLSYTAFIDKYYTDEELEKEIISYPLISELQEELQALKQVLRRRKLNKLK